MGRGNGESITARARISRQTNVSKTNQNPVFVTYCRKEICMHPHAEKRACTPSLYIAQCACMHKLRGACTSTERSVRKNPRTQIYSNTTSMTNMHKQNVRTVTGMGKTWGMLAQRAGVGVPGCNCRKSSEPQFYSHLCHSTYWSWCVRPA